ncbi:hypothetical protein DLJ53_01415 [Acuticoccus sediminis]|uniref:Cation efflux protein transmembrane domain-containing protein n=1 Tax=Acuticoccus sediminis TaxID=2184697 RepID=A0A8B2P3P7_9HYPH|nr:cation transporter [Acuticoccus sediminis]RAI03209.1 hypothetical protein DLJ53_01415 [Acuticoccus sediminis]
MRDAVRAPRRLNFQQLQLVSITLSTVIAGPQLVAALGSTSIGLIGDAVFTVIYILFSLLVFLTTRAARHSCALVFPYGTGKLEAIASSILAVSFTLSGLGIASASLYRVLEPSPPESVAAPLVITTILLAQSAALYALSAPLAKEPSGVVKAWRRAQLIDVCGLGLTIVLVSAAAFDPRFAIGDPIAGCVIASAMLYTAYQTFRNAFWELADRALEEKVQLLILRGLADSFDAFDDILDIRTRRSGGVPIIEIALGFAMNREWRTVVARCEQVRRSVVASVEGAEVLVLPATPALMASQAPAGAAA